MNPQLGGPRQAGAGELELISAHAHAEDFGHVLQWCTLRTDALFASPTEAWLARDEAEDIDRATLGDLRPWTIAERKFYEIRDARQAERRLSGEAA